ncbi:MAG: ATP-binding protein [Alphaproteobacteria bacterium]|nr:ATP-binding protein [Alphaproteobacteria bacterium]
MYYRTATSVNPTLQPLPGHARQERSHYFFTEEEACLLSAIMDKPYRHFIEVREYAHLGKVLAFIRGETPQYSLSLTTRSAFRQPVAEVLSRHLGEQCNLSPGRISDIKTCVQEAVMNAIIHGNLMIEPANRATDHFRHYLDSISAAAEDEVLGLKRVSVFAWIDDQRLTICVCDQGAGFSLDQPTSDIAAPYGRGLPLIRAMSHRLWQTAPNRLYMQFLTHG